MSILLRHADIPKYGHRIAILSDGHAYYEDFINPYVDLGEVVLVPKHGRLIDADALGIREAEKQAYEAYLREKREFFTEEPLLEYMRGRLEGLTHASGLVRFAPTIIPASKGEV